MKHDNVSRRVFNLPRLYRLLDYLSGEKVVRDLGKPVRNVFIPLMALIIFVLLWSVAASKVQTSLGVLPGPSMVWQQMVGLYHEYEQEQVREAEFYQRLQLRYDKAVAAGKSQEKIDRIAARRYTGSPTFIDQIITSLITVATGFLLGSIIAIPIGIVCGMSPTLYRAFNPIIQIFKPVSPLAWLPLVTMVVSALYVSNDPLLDKSFLTSAITVTLCCLWPTVINTTVGVSGVDRDLINVSQVLQLNWITKTLKIVLPSAMPMIFTGLRLSLSIGWMVLIAAEMLAQNPGLGKFVWDEFQNGSSSSLARIMVAVLTIGGIGFILDRVMLSLQAAVSWDKKAALR